MKFKFFLKIVAGLFITSNTLLGEEPAFLKTEDVHKIMEQILSQHAEENKVTAPLIKNSLKVYIEQFDAYHTYLLEEEAKPYLEISEEELQKLVAQYEKSNFEVYTKLNELFKKAISRSRNIRQELLKNDLDSIEDASNYTDDQVKNALYNKTYAQNETELKQRIENQFRVLFQAEKKRYGDQYVQKNQKAIFEIYSKRLKSFENQYLPERKGVLSQAEKDNAFVMHILKSMASSLDAHTEFYNPKEAFDMKMHLENSFQGVGLNIQDSPEGIIVADFVPGSPAAKSGLIKAFDQIIEVDGKNISEEEVGDVTKMLQGKADSSVTLLLKRKIKENSQIADKELTVTLKREAITIDEGRVVSTFEHFGNGIIGKITLNSFYQNNKGVSSEKDVRDALEKLQKQGNLRGLILDLRENTGGFLSQAVKVAGLFITNGVIVVSKYSNGDERFFRDMDGKTFYDGPLVILTSKMTASAAEIVAESLQDYGVAVVVGDKTTYGKGTVQTQTVTQDKASSYFKVTIGKYYTVSGNTPQIKGVIADVVVPGKYSNEKIGEAYLGGHVLKNDQIEASFDDKFEDLDPITKSWYLHYYVPTEQKKVQTWKNLVPLLQKNSAYRIEQNKNYQSYLKRLRGEKEEVDPDSETPTQKKNFGNEDLQMIEAVNVLKDMISLEAKTRTTEKK